MTSTITSTTPPLPASTAPIEQNPAAVYLASLTSADSRRTMRQALDVVAGLLTECRETALTLDWSAVRFQHAAAIRAQLADRYSPATTNKILAALRGVLKNAYLLEQISAEDYQRSRGVSGVKGSTLPRGRALPPLDLAALFRACQNDGAAGIRDAALFAVLFGAGLRRAEVAALDVADLDLAAGTVTVRQGKGRKDRIGHLAGGAAERLEAWLAVRGDDPGALFVPVNQVRELTIRRMSSQAIYNAFDNRARSAGIADVSPHDVRRTFSSALLDTGADLAIVQQLAGHANVATTAR